MQGEVKPPQISEETLNEMAAFFMKTSIPRIIAAKREKKLKEAANEEQMATKSK